jgi:uncharacterized protein
MRFVLVHGAFVGAWCWEPLVGPLEAAGHTVETFDLPGSGEDRTPLAEVTLDAYADRVCAVLGERPEPAVVVAGSMGGMAATQAAVRCSGRVASIVYVAAFLPQDGQSLLELTRLPEGRDDQVQANLVVEGDPPVATMPAEAARQAVYGCCSMRWRGGRSSGGAHSPSPPSASRWRSPTAPSTRSRAATSSASETGRSRRPSSAGCSSRPAAPRWSSSTPTTSRTCRPPTSWRKRSTGSPPHAASISGMTILEVETPHGPAHVHLQSPDDPRAALVLGHGAGGGVASRDLAATAVVALSEGITVALVEQPYRVAGRRSPAPARQLDAAWTAVVEQLAAGELRGLPLVVGGRSLGARVACRTAGATGAVAVLCLAFPLQPPRRSGGAPTESRLAELDEVTVPTLVVQGERDRFGIPPASRNRTVVQVPGDHSLRTDLDAVAAAVRDWLPGVVGARVADVT